MPYVTKHVNEQKLADTHGRPISVFIATDSSAVAESARRWNGSQLTLYMLHPLDRDKYDSAERIEYHTAKRGARDKLAVLLEALLEVTLLARSQIICGAMFGNIPRLALQLWARDRGNVADGAPYISLDGYEWCIDGRCTRPMPVKSTGA